MRDFEINTNNVIINIKSLIIRELYHYLPNYKNFLVSIGNNLKVIWKHDNFIIQYV